MTAPDRARIVAMTVLAVGVGFGVWDLLYGVRTQVEQDRNRALRDPRKIKREPEWSRRLKRKVMGLDRLGTQKLKRSESK